MTYEMQLKTLVLDGLIAGKTRDEIRALVEEAIAIDAAVDEALKAPVIQFPQTHRRSA